jgi:hypothetical protein
MVFMPTQTGGNQFIEKSFRPQVSINLTEIFRLVRRNSASLRRKGYQLMGGVVVGVAILSACVGGPALPTESPATEQAESGPGQTDVVTAPKEPTATLTPEPTAAPTPTVDAYTGYEKIPLSQEFNDGKTTAYFKDGEVTIVDSAGVELIPNESGFYTVDGQFWAFYAEEGKMIPLFEAANGNLRRWNGEQGRYQQVTIEQEDGQPVNVNAHELHLTDYGWVAEYKGGATALINSDTGEVSPLTNRNTLKNQTVLNPEGQLKVWDGEKDQWIDAVQLREDQVVFWDGYNFVPLTDTLNQTVTADTRIETPQGVVFAKDGVLTAVVDRNRPVAAYKGEAPIGLGVYRLEGSELIDTGKNWLEWRLYDPETNEPREDLTYVNFPNASRVDLGGMFVDPSIGRFRAALNNPGAITGFWDAIVKQVSASETEPILTFKAVNLRTGKLETFTNVPVTQIDFYATAQNMPDGMPSLPFVTPFAESPTENFGFGLAYDPESESVVGITELSPFTSSYSEFRYGNGTTGLLVWSGEMFLEGSMFPLYSTNESVSSGRIVLDQTGSNASKAQQIAESSGLWLNKLITWQILK